MNNSTTTTTTEGKWSRTIQLRAATAAVVVNENKKKENPLSSPSAKRRLQGSRSRLPRDPLCSILLLFFILNYIFLSSSSSLFSSPSSPPSSSSSPPSLIFVSSFSPAVLQRPRRRRQQQRCRGGLDNRRRRRRRRQQQEQCRGQHDDQRIYHGQEDRLLWHYCCCSSRLYAAKQHQQQQDDSDSAGLSRRRAVGELALAATGLGVTGAGVIEFDPVDYGLWGILPVGTYKRKKTILETVVPDTVWTLDQKFGILNVQVPLRMVIVKLKGEGLLVYNPIAATRECLSLVKSIVEKHGPVRHVVVGSVALEHKVYAGVFAQKFKQAQVWLTPGQYSFPVNLPDTFLGFPPGGRTNVMPRTIDEGAPGEWKESGIDFATLGPIISRDGAFAETVVFHRPTNTLLVTDTCLQVTDEVPAIYDTDPSPLLYHARDDVTEVVEDTAEVRMRGWRRLVLFGLFFTPQAIDIQDVRTALDERRPDINPDFAGIYPWTWGRPQDEAESWKGLTGTKPDESCLVAPILQTLLLNRNPVEVLDFADRVAEWPIARIIPAHLKNNLPLTGKEYRAAFQFLEERGVPAGFPKPLDADLSFLRDAEKDLEAAGAIAPEPPKVGGQYYSRADILARTTYRCRAGVCAPRSEP